MLRSRLPKEGRSKTQKTTVLEHLESHGTLTSIQAFDQYGITRLAEYIRQLRHDDKLAIRSVKQKGLNRFGAKANWVKYTLMTDGSNSL